MLFFFTFSHAMYTVMRIKRTEYVHLIARIRYYFLWARVACVSRGSVDQLHKYEDVETNVFIIIGSSKIGNQASKGGIVDPL